MTHLLSIAADPRRLALGFWLCAIVAASRSPILAYALALYALVLDHVEAEAPQ
jgi:hypothetical protein